MRCRTVWNGGGMSAILREDRREFQVEWTPGLWQDEVTMPFPRADEMADLALKRVAASGAEYANVSFFFF